MKESIVKIEKVWKTYTIGENKVHALRGLDLEIKKGEFVAIQGPSGSGKSTAMNMIGALDTPSKGSVFLDGHNIASLSESELAQIRGKKIGFIFQQFNLIPSLSALENVTLPLIFQGVPSEERKEKARETLELVGLGDRMDHRPTQLSGGQQQRVAIARALAGNPEMVLADEPTGNLDSKTGDTVLSFLENLHEKKGKTIVMVTHDTNVAKAADRVEFLKDGAIIKSQVNRR
ncbi:MAG: ABC transporter ATP-binding protein [Nanoarchaeota archaeon]